MARGWRQPLPKWWPAELRALIEACWAGKPALRPSMGEVVDRIKAMEGHGVFQEMDTGKSKLKEKTDSAVKCCVIS